MGSGCSPRVSIGRRALKVECLTEVFQGCGCLILRYMVGTIWNS